MEDVVRPEVGRCPSSLVGWAKSREAPGDSSCILKMTECSPGGLLLGEGAVWAARWSEEVILRKVHVKKPV